MDMTVDEPEVRNQPSQEQLHAPVSGMSLDDTTNPADEQPSSLNEPNSSVDGQRGSWRDDVLVDTSLDSESTESHKTPNPQIIR
jgi:hypothetical protein